MNHQLTEALVKRNLHNIRKVGRSPIWRYPRQYEILYRSFAVSIVSALREATGEILGRLPHVIAQRDAETHTDAWPDSLDNLLTTLRIGFNDIAHSEKIKARLLDIGQKTSDWNDKQWQETLLKVLGVDVYRRESFLGSHLKSFVQEGASLITKLTEDTYHDVATTITRGIRSGDRVNTIKDAILTETDLGPGVFNKVETRARLIARDQVGKLNGELTRIRQEGIGVKWYRWHTVLDERVRESHAVLDGKICRWDDSTVYADSIEDALADNWLQRSEINGVEMQPGEDYQCRCWAEAIFPEEVTEEEAPTEEEETTVEETPVEPQPQPEPEPSLTEEIVQQEAQTLVLSPSVEEVAATREEINYLDYSNIVEMKTSGTAAQDVLDATTQFKTFIDETEAWRQSLSSDEVNALKDFTSTSKFINMVARGKDISGTGADEILIKKQIPTMEKALSRASLPKDVVVWRGFGIDFLQSDPTLLKGKIFVQPIFQSTSVRKGEAEYFKSKANDYKKILLKIKVRKGVKGIGYVDPISRIKGEGEATLNRNAKILIQKIKLVKDKDWIVEGVLLP